MKTYKKRKRTVIKKYIKGCSLKFKSKNKILNKINKILKVITHI